MVVQNAQQALDNANADARCDAGYCLRYVREWLEIPSREADAQGAWDTAKYKHPGDTSPPDGAPVFWRSGPGGSGHGHIALTMKNVPMRTTDKSQATYVNNDDGSWPRVAWGQSYLGWTEDLNGVEIPYLRKASSGSGDDWRASGKVYVEKLHRGQHDSDSVSRLRYRLQHHKKMPDSKRPGYGADYGEKVQAAVAYWQQEIMSQEDKGPRDGHHLTNSQANRLFGDNYTVIEQ